MRIGNVFGSATHESATHRLLSQTARPLTNRVLVGLSALAVSALVGAPNVVAGPAGSGGAIVDITSTSIGAKIALQGAARIAAKGIPTDASSVHVWQIAAGEYLVADHFPTGFKTMTTHASDGSTRVAVEFQVSATISSQSRAGVADTSETATAQSVSWAWLNQFCFTRLSNAWGWLDTCYITHYLAGETDPRDFFQLEQYGTVAAAQYVGKIYDGWEAAVKASGSSTMSWIDWTPRSNYDSGCTSVNLSIAALNTSISSPAFFCQHVVPTKYADAGHFKIDWNCGCIYPFGQPYPNSRELDYMQAVSVPGGGAAIWTLSAGFTAQ